MIHFDGVKRAKFSAQATIHTNININKEFLWFGLWTPTRKLASDDPNALRWAYLGANSAGSAPVMGPLFARFRLVSYQERDESEAFWYGQFFLRIEHGHYASSLEALTIAQGFRIVVSSASCQPVDII
jgi:hypothetical protein